uniref:HORMA domain containing 2 n=1 Tax=Zosterops lateralis melanops TaxID=1220523 RepID=A0A8D2PHE6_ZOSLA
MATQQLLKQKKKPLLFPESITTEQQSLVLVKRLLAISMSCITYMRGLFPESSYGTRYLDDLCLKILREDKSCLGSLQITVTEMYQFKFKYKKKVPQMDISSNHREFVAGLCSNDVKQASRLLLRTLYLLMQDLGPLPNDITLSMKLLYYNDGRWRAVCALGKNSISLCNKCQPCE